MFQSISWAVGCKIPWIQPEGGLVLLFFFIFFLLCFFHPQYSIPEGIRNYIKDSTSSVNSQDAAAKLLRYKIELNLWMVTEMRCIIFFHPQYTIPEGIRNHIKGGTLDSTSSVNTQDAAAKLPRYKIELNLWMVTEMRCRRC